MALDERSRHELVLRLEESLGPEAATTLMEHLPPAGWADVAMKRDLDHLEVVMRGDLDSLEQRLDTRIDRLEQRLDTRIDQVEERLDTLEERLDTRFDNLEERLTLRIEASEHRMLAAFRGEIQTAILAQGRQMAITLVGTAGAICALAFTAARLTS